MDAYDEMIASQLGDEPRELYCPCGTLARIEHACPVTFRELQQQLAAAQQQIQEQQAAIALLMLRVVSTGGMTVMPAELTILKQHVNAEKVKMLEDIIKQFNICIPRNEIIQFNVYLYKMISELKDKQ